MAKENSRARLTGTVFAVTNLIITLGGVVFQPLVGHILDSLGGNRMVNGEYLYSVAHYQVALSVLPISLLIVIIIGFFLKDHARYRTGEKTN